MRKSVRNIYATSLLVLLTACQSVESPEPIVSNSPEKVSAEQEIPAAGGARALDIATGNVEAAIAAPLVYDNLWDRMRDGFQLSRYYDHSAVASYIQSYSQQQRYFDLLQERASPFLYWIVEEIDRRGLPLEFALLPMVESTFNPNAYSSEHAVGLWQFLGATGSSFGLQQDWWFDARRDPHASTVAALDYMEQLFLQFDQDWLLAIAAYNAGDGNLRRAIRNSDSEEVDFWELNLPGETEAHIPKLLALAAIVSDASSWGIELRPLANAPVLRSVSIGTQIDISQAARLAEIDYEELRALNPGYLQWATHPDQPQEILLPFINAERLESALIGVDKNDLLSWDRYEIKPGDTLGTIARRLNTRVDILQTFNSLVGSRIVAGESLLIPRTNDPALLALAPQIGRVASREPLQIPAEYRVRNGDNLWSIARRYNLRSKEIAAWNQISQDQLLHPGQTLDLRYALEDTEAQPSLQVSDNAAVYIVRRGDNMDAIARRLDIDLKNLLLWNGLSIGAIIFPGQQLQVTAETTGNDQI
ncbi:MAG: LysM peptidoglycan-binding domain-containing protein [Pseudohongiellaceae bacterium]